MKECAGGCGRIKDVTYRWYCSFCRMCNCITLAEEHGLVVTLQKGLRGLVGVGKKSEK